MSVPKAVALDRGPCVRCSMRASGCPTPAYREMMRGEPWDCHFLAEGEPDQGFEPVNPYSSLVGGRPAGRRRWVREP